MDEDISGKVLTCLIVGVPGVFLLLAGTPTLGLFCLIVAAALSQDR